MLSNPADKSDAELWRTRASAVLAALTHGSASFITTFLHMHLTAPAAANPVAPRCHPKPCYLGVSTTRLHLENGTSYSGHCSYTRPARSSIAFSPHGFHARSLVRFLSLLADDTPRVVTREVTSQSQPIMPRPVVHGTGVSGTPPSQQIGANPDKGETRR
ncbi:hypothetical protein EI94DRAFT_134046 [Lactarius quietus]|nr:hypothetical protein EI94DRAFT_134046 [Lactarius quietus]